MSESEKFVFSSNEERYDSVFYDTREEALNAARDEEPDGGAVFTGIAKSLKLSDGATIRNLEWWWDTVEENFWEEVGEVSELPKPSKEAFEELRASINEWATKHDLHPKFFRVDDVQIHYPDGRVEEY